MQHQPIYDFLILKLDCSTTYVVTLRYFMIRDKVTMTYSTVCGIGHYCYHNIISKLLDKPLWHHISTPVVLNLFRMTEHLTFYKIFAEHNRKIK
jgi:hypothetical protein